MGIRPLCFRERGIHLLRSCMELGRLACAVVRLDMLSRGRPGRAQLS